MPQVIEKKTIAAPGLIVAITAGSTLALPTSQVRVIGITLMTKPIRANGSSSNPIRAFHRITATRRQIALPRFLSDELARHLAEWPRERAGFVFEAPESGLRRTNFRRRSWLPAVRASVGEPLRFHDFRHTRAAMLIAECEHPKVI